HQFQDVFEIPSHIEPQLSRRAIGPWRKTGAQQRELFRIEPARVERIEVRLRLRTAWEPQNTHPAVATYDVYRKPKCVPGIGRQNDNIGSSFTKTNLQLC